MGKYLTLEMADYVTRRGQSFPDCAAALRDLLKSFEAVERAQRLPIACLGNRAVTPDAVGPLTADGIIVTRGTEILASAGFCGVFVRIRCAPRVF